MKKSVRRCCVVLVRACAVALISSSVVAGGGFADIVLVEVMYPASVCCDLPSFTKFARAFLTRLSHLRRTDGLL